MAAWPIAKLPLTALRERLSHETYGLNAVYNAKRGYYGLTKDLAITFDSRSPNFFPGDFNPEQLIGAVPAKYPFMTIFSRGIKVENLQKFHQFSGPVEIQINVFLSWPDQAPREIFTDSAECMTESIVEVLNRAPASLPGAQDWGDEVTYNGDIEMVPSEIVLGGGFWKQLLQFKLMFEVDQRGDV